MLNHETTEENQPYWYRRFPALAGRVEISRRRRLRKLGLGAIIAAVITAVVTALGVGISQAAPGIAMVGLVGRTKKQSDKDAKYSKQAAIVDAGSKPVAVKRVARFRNTMANPSTDSGGINRQFPLLIAADSNRHMSRCGGLSPMWIATMLNARAARDNGDGNQFAFCEYIMNEPVTRESALIRHGMFRPFEDSSLANVAFYALNSNNGLANIFTPETALDAARAWKMELDYEIGKHHQFLDLCNFINDVYHSERLAGAAGYGAEHQDENGLDRTPYTALYNILFEQFDKTKLSLTTQEQTVATLGDLADAARALFEEAGHSSQFQSVASIGAKVVNQEAFTYGMAKESISILTVTPEGTPVMTIPAFSGDTVTNIEDLKPVWTAPVGDWADELYTSDSVGNLMPGSVDVNEAVADSGKTTSLAKIAVRLPGTHRIMTATHAATIMSSYSNRIHIVDGSLYTHSNYDEHMVKPLDDELVRSASDIMHVRTLWNQQSHVVLEYLRAANELLPAELLELGDSYAPIPTQLDGASRFKSIHQDDMWLKEHYEEVNVYSPIKPQFNPRSDSQTMILNNGPYHPDVDDDRYYRMRDLVSNEAKAEQMSQHFLDHDTVPTGLGLIKMKFSDLATAMPDAVFESLFSARANPVSKRERNVVIPNGRADASGLKFGIDPTGSYLGQYRLMRRLLTNPPPSKQWYMPGSDVVLSDDVGDSLTDIVSQSTLNLALGRDQYVRSIGAAPRPYPPSTSLGELKSLRFSSSPNLELSWREVGTPNNTYSEVGDIFVAQDLDGSDATFTHAGSGKQFSITDPKVDVSQIGAASTVGTNIGAGYSDRAWKSAEFSFFSRSVAAMAQFTTSFRSAGSTVYSHTLGAHGAAPTDYPVEIKDAYGAGTDVDIREIVGPAMTRGADLFCNTATGVIGFKVLDKRYATVAGSTTPVLTSLKAALVYDSNDLTFAQPTNLRNNVYQLASSFTPVGTNTFRVDSPTTTATGATQVLVDLGMLSANSTAVANAITATEGPQDLIKGLCDATVHDHVASDGTLSARVMGFNQLTDLGTFTFEHDGFGAPVLPATINITEAMMLDTPRMMFSVSGAVNSSGTTPGSAAFAIITSSNGKDGRAVIANDFADDYTSFMGLLLGSDAAQVGTLSPDDAAAIFNPEVLVPSKINVMVNPEDYLLMAAVAKYAGMRFYPSALNPGGDNAEDFKGLPYFGTPETFMRGIVAEHAPELILVDAYVANPLFSPVANKVYIKRVEYEPKKYITASINDLAEQGQTSHSQLTADSIVRAEESVRLRRSFYRA